MSTIRRSRALDDRVNEAHIPRSEAFAELPPVWPEPLLPAIRARIEAQGQRLVVLDDDPTGTQTVHGLPVLTEWSVDSLATELERSPVFYVLTNSRALGAADAVTLAREVARNLVIAAKLSGRRYVVNSRSDSTLRGHFPAEVDALSEVLTDGDVAPYAGYVVAPYFAEGGRFTIGDVHYVLQGETLVPAAQTEFARDPVFGYAHSALPEWVQEKTGGRVRAIDVVCVTLDDLRREGPAAVTAKLLGMPQGGATIVNSADDRDQEVFVTGLLDAEALGRRFIYRTAASFVRVRGGIAQKPLLDADETRGEGGAGGLVVVGSHVAKTSDQLRAALELPEVASIELSVDALLDPAREKAEQARALAEINARLAAGVDAILSTSRALRTGGSAEESLAIAKTVSNALCHIVQHLSTRPRFLIAKGGITSSDVATRVWACAGPWCSVSSCPASRSGSLAARARSPACAMSSFPATWVSPTAWPRRSSVFGGGDDARLGAIATREGDARRQRDRLVQHVQPRDHARDPVGR
jgi:uncharacterized protein YgbK (DUF1537 family)